MRPAAATPMTSAPERSPASRHAGLRFQADEAELALKVDLSDLVLPQVDNLHVDGLQRSWFARLFSK